MENPDTAKAKNTGVTREGRFLPRAHGTALHRERVVRGNFVLLWLFLKKESGRPEFAAPHSLPLF